MLESLEAVHDVNKTPIIEERLRPKDNEAEKAAEKEEGTGKGSPLAQKSKHRSKRGGQKRKAPGKTDPGPPKKKGRIGTPETLPNSKNKLDFKDKIDFHGTQMEGLVFLATPGFAKMNYSVTMAPNHFKKE